MSSTNFTGARSPKNVARCPFALSNCLRSGRRLHFGVRLRLPLLA
jgi:hypothetical protein